MGVLNVTPDSFSDGGCFADTAVRGRARPARCTPPGADYVDVGGESTRPGADRVDAEEECRRVLPVIRELTAAGVRTSVDTTRAEVAEAAHRGRRHPGQRRQRRAGRQEHGRAGRRGRRAVGAHALARAQPRDVRGGPVRRRRHRGVRRAHGAGRGRRRRRRRPGAAGARPRARASPSAPSTTGRCWPAWTGWSGSGCRCWSAPPARPSSAGCSPTPTAPCARPSGRDDATLATTVLAAQAGAWGVRVHDAGASVDAVRTVEAVRAARSSVRG